MSSSCSGDHLSWRWSPTLEFINPQSLSTLCLRLAVEIISHRMVPSPLEFINSQSLLTLCLHFAAKIIPHRDGPQFVGVHQLSEFINTVSLLGIVSPSHSFCGACNSL